jgi:hypothetical protein
MRKRTLTAILVGGLMATMLPGVASANFGNGPSSAGVVERFNDPGFAAIPDFDEGLLLFANVNSVSDACNGIPAGAGNVQVVTLRSGAVVVLLHDDDIPLIVTPLAPPEAVCADPANWPVIATGIGKIRATDNNADESLTRTNSFGQRVTGSVVDGNGDAWSVQAHFKARVTKDDEFILTREGINLVKRGKK